MYYRVLRRVTWTLIGHLERISRKRQESDIVRRISAYYAA